MLAESLLRSRHVAANLSKSQSDPPSLKSSPNHSASSAMEATIVSTSGVLSSVDYKDLYVQRVQGLDRFKRKLERDFGSSERLLRIPSMDTSDLIQENGHVTNGYPNLYCNLENSAGYEDAYSGPSSSATQFYSAMFDLKSAIVSLVETDLILMRQLIKLNDAVKSVKQHSPNSTATISSGRSPKQENSPTLSASLSCAIEEEQEESRDLSEDAFNRLPDFGPAVSPSSTLTGRQYFARQNSVLRIPIPPRKERQRFSMVDTLLRRCELEDGSSSGFSSNSSSGDSTLCSVKPGSTNSFKILLMRRNSDQHPSSGPSRGSPLNQPLLIRTDIRPLPPDSPPLPSPSTMSASSYSAETLSCGTGGGGSNFSPGGDMTPTSSPEAIMAEQHCVQKSFDSGIQFDESDEYAESVMTDVVFV